MFLNWLNDIVAKRAYSRKLEEEADAVGLEIMAMAGYDPRGMADLWELMKCVEIDAEAAGHTSSLDNRVAFLRSHPTSDERHEVSCHIANATDDQKIEKLMPKAMEVWRKYRGKRRPDLVKQVAEIQKELEDLDAQGRAAPA